MSVRDLLAFAFMMGGSLLVLLAAIGLVRMPDLFLRMSASSKGASLGVAFILLGAVLDFDDVGVASRAAATILFIFLTVPVAAHLIGRAGYRTGVELWRGTRMDELGTRPSRSSEPPPSEHG